MKYASVNRTRIVGIGATIAVVAVVGGCSASQDDSNPTSPSSSPVANGSVVPASTSSPAAMTTTQPVPRETGGGTTSEHPSTDEKPTAAPVDYCATADLARLRDSVAASPLAARLYQPIALDRFSCSGRYAVAHNVTDGTVTPVTILYEYSDGSWTAIDMGSAMDCGSQGVPAADRARLPGCY